MSRLPKPGADSGSWGTVLNDFLSVELNSDGSLKKAADITSAAQTASTASTKADEAQSTANAAKTTADAAAVNTTVVHNTSDESIAGIKTFSSSPLVPTPTTSSQAANKSYVDSTVSAGAPDASTTTKGIVRLTGDLAGTATAPTVPGLAAKEPTITAGTTAQYYRGDKSFQTLDKSAVGLGSVDNTTDATKPVSTAQQTALNLKLDKATVTTKGDLLAATASATIARVGVGTDGQVLTADTASTPGVKWSTPTAAPVTSVVGQTGVVTTSQVATAVAGDMALTGAYALRSYPSSLPSGVTLVKTYEPRLQAYNVTDTSLRRIRLAVARARDGGAPVRILQGGDSITYGIAGSTPYYQNGYPQRLRGLLNNTWGLPTQDGAVWANNVGGSADDTRITINAGWSLAGGRASGPPGTCTGMGGGGFWAGTVGSAGLLTYTPNTNVDTFTFYWIDISQSPTISGTFSYNIDGGSFTTVTPTATAGTTFIRATTVTGLSNGAHTLGIKPTPTSSRSTLIVGMEGYLSSSKPILVSAQGIGSTNSAYWNNPASIYGSSPLILNTYAPDLLTLNLGMNDSRTTGDALAVDVTTFQSNITNLVQTVRTNGGDVILIPAYQSDGGSQGSVQPYVQAMYAIADSLDVAIFDLNARWPTIATAMSGGLVSGDHVHPLSKGYWDIAYGLSALLRNSI